MKLKKLRVKKMKRRSFLKAAGAASAATALPVISSTASAHTPEEKYRSCIPEVFDPVAKPPAYTPALVIGSGFGGAISAYRLAQAGIETTVLERGLRWPMDHSRDIHSGDFAPDGRAYWHRTEITHLTGLSFSFDKFSLNQLTSNRDLTMEWTVMIITISSRLFNI